MELTKRKALIPLLLSILLVIGLVPSTAQAATSNKKVTKCNSFETATVNKKATKVTRGTTRLTYKAARGYVKFTAPASKTYKLTLSKLSNSSMPYGFCGWAWICKSNNYGRLAYQTVKTNGGKAFTLWVGSTKFTDKKATKTINRCIRTRSARISLNKGETIYILFSSYKNSKLTLKIS